MMRLMLPRLWTNINEPSASATTPPGLRYPALNGIRSPIPRDSRVPAPDLGFQFPMLFPDHQIRWHQCRGRSVHYRIDVVPRHRGLAHLQVSPSPCRHSWLEVGPNPLPSTQLPYSSRLFHLSLLYRLV